MDYLKTKINRAYGKHCNFFLPIVFAFIFSSLSVAAFTVTDGGQVQIEETSFDGVEDNITVRLTNTGTANLSLDPVNPIRLTSGAPYYRIEQPDVENNRIEAGASVDFTVYRKDSLFTTTATFEFDTPAEQAGTDEIYALTISGRNSPAAASGDISVVTFPFGRVDLSAAAPMGSVVNFGDGFNDTNILQPGAGTARRVIRITNLKATTVQFTLESWANGAEGGVPIVTALIPTQIPAGGYVDIVVEVPLDVPLPPDQSAELAGIITSSFDGVAEHQFNLNALILGMAAPVANDDSATTRPKTAVVKNILDNDTFEGAQINPASVTISLSSEAQNDGVAVVDAAGNLTWTPSGDFKPGSDDTVITSSFDYTIVNGNGLPSTANITIDVVNNKPVAGDDSVDTRPRHTVDGHNGVVINVLTNDSDPDAGDAANFVPEIETGPTAGIAVVNPDNTITYTPSVGTKPTGSALEATDSFIYRIFDGKGKRDQGRVTVHIKNRRPVAGSVPVQHMLQNPGATVPETSRSVNVITGIASDPEGDAVKIRDHTTFFIRNRDQLAASGWVVGTHLVRESDTNILINLPSSFRPNDGSATISQVIQYQVADEYGRLGNGSFTVTAGNNRPVAADDVVFIRPGRASPGFPWDGFYVNLVANDADADGDTLVLTANGLEVPPGWDVERWSDTQIRVNSIPEAFRPTISQDSVTGRINYRIRDGHGGRAKGSLYVHVTNNPPEQLEFGQVHIGAVLSTAVTQIDYSPYLYDPDGDNLVASGFVTPGKFGSQSTASLNLFSGNSLLIDYSPSEHFIGWDKIDLTVHDELGPDQMSPTGQSHQLLVPVSRHRGFCPGTVCKYFTGDWNGDGIETMAATYLFESQSDSDNYADALAVVYKDTIKPTNEVRILRFYPEIDINIDGGYVPSTVDNIIDPIKKHNILQEIWMTTEPLAGDWDGDGRDGFALYHRATNPVAGTPCTPTNCDWDGTYYIMTDQAMLGNSRAVTTNESGMTLEDLKQAPIVANPSHKMIWQQAPQNLNHGIPVVGDWDGDGYDQIGFYIDEDNLGNRLGRLMLSYNLYSSPTNYVAPDPDSVPPPTDEQRGNFTQSTADLASKVDNIPNVASWEPVSSVPGGVGLNPQAGNLDGLVGDEFYLWGHHGATVGTDDVSIIRFFNIGASSPTANNVVHTVRGYNATGCGGDCNKIHKVYTGDFREFTSVGNDVLQGRETFAIQTQGYLWLSPLALEGSYSFNDPAQGNQPSVSFGNDSDPIESTPPPTDDCGVDSHCARLSFRSGIITSRPVAISNSHTLNSAELGAVVGTAPGTTMTQQPIVDTPEATFAYAHNIAKADQVRQGPLVGTNSHQPVKVYVHHKSGDGAMPMALFSSTSVNITTSTTVLNPPSPYQSCESLCVYLNGGSVVADGSQIDFGDKDNLAQSTVTMVIVNGSDLPYSGTLQLDTGLSINRSAGVILAANSATTSFTVTATHGASELFAELGLVNSDDSTEDFVQPFRIGAMPDLYDDCDTLCVYINGEKYLGQSYPVYSEVNAIGNVSFLVHNGTEVDGNVSLSLPEQFDDTRFKISVSGQEQANGSSLLVPAGNTQSYTLSYTHLPENAVAFTSVAPSFSLYGNPVTVNFKASDCQDVCLYAGRFRLKADQDPNVFAFRHHTKSLDIRVLNTRSAVVDVSGMTVTGGALSLAEPASGVVGPMSASTQATAVVKMNANMNISQGVEDSTITFANVAPITASIKSFPISVLMGIIGQKFNQSPVINSTPIEVAMPDVLYSYQIGATDPDDDPLTYGAPTRPSWLSIDSASGLLSGTPTQEDLESTAGKHEVVVTVNDGQSTVKQSFELTVTNAPLFTSIPITSVNEDQKYFYQLAASDLDGDAISITAVTVPWWLIYNEVTKTLSGTPTLSQVGTHAVKFEVTDGYFTVEQAFNITVVNVNDAPVITSTAFRNATQGTPYSYTLTATDEEGDGLTYFANELPASGWLTFDEGTRLLSGTPGVVDIGIHTITLGVSDSNSTVTQTFKITVD